MRTLILDTATSTLFAAVMERGQVLAELHLPGGKQATSLLVRGVQTVCEMAGTELHALERVITGVGPGSYTGVRAGVMFGRSFAHGRRLPCLAISSLCLYPPREVGSYVAAFDARAGGLYVQRLHWDGERLHLESSAERVSWEGYLAWRGPGLPPTISPHAHTILERLPELEGSVMEVRASAGMLHGCEDLTPVQGIDYGPSRWTSFLSQQPLPC